MPKGLKLNTNSQVYTPVKLLLKNIEILKSIFPTCVAGMPQKPPVNPVNYAGWDGRYQFSREYSKLFSNSLYNIIAIFQVLYCSVLNIT